MSAISTLMGMLIPFICLPLYSLYRASNEGRAAINWRDVMWLVLYTGIGLKVMRSFALYVKARGLL